MAEPKKTILHYQILEPLGKGGMGMVYKALDTKLRRPVALKMLLPGSASDVIRKSRLTSEAHAAAGLNHPNVCVIYEINEDGSDVFIAMEYIQGKTLMDLLSSGPMDVDQGLQVAAQIADALDKAHRSNIVHRDLKPSNVMINEEGQAKVLDFGLAQVKQPVLNDQVSRLETVEQLTSPGTVPGTVSYMSPEQLTGNEVDFRTDLFSFGLLLHQIFTGLHPFPRKTPFEVASAILKEDPPSMISLNPQVPPQLQRIVSRALQKDPEKRYASMHEMEEELKKLREDAGRANGRERQVAVLYFENLSGDKGDEYLRDGMTEDIITELSKIKMLRVFPRSSVAVYLDQTAPAKEIGRTLGADYVLQGSLRRSGQRLRITPQLVETTTGHVVWSEKLDRQLVDIFEIQDEIAHRVAEALRIQLSQQEQDAIAQKPTQNTHAYDYYLRGRSYVRRVTRQDLDYALQMYESAIRLQPDFALAHVGIANVCAMAYDWYEKNETRIERGVAEAELALQLDPELAEALAARARICWAQQNYDQGIRFARAAIARKESCEGAHWTLGMCLLMTGHYTEVLRIGEDAIARNDDDYNVYIPALNAAGLLGMKAAEDRMAAQILQVLKKQLETVPEDARARVLLANTYAKLGQSEESLHHLQQAVRLRPDDPNMLYNAACAYARLGMKREAIEKLQLAAKHGFPNREWIARDGDLVSLHGDPDFEAIIAD